MSISVGDVIHINQVIRVDGVNAVIGADYELEDAGTTTSDLDLMNALILDNWNPTFIEGAWKDANDSDVVAVCLKVRKILPVKEDDFVYIQNEIGALLGDHMPSHAAAMITKTALLTGPGSSGRTFFPAPPTGHFTGGHLNAGGALLWNAVASFLNDVISLGAAGTRWAPQHIQPSQGLHGDVFRTWVNPNIRTVRSRQAVNCPV